MNATANNPDRAQSIGRLDGMATRAACRLRIAIRTVGAKQGVMFERRPGAVSCTMTVLQTAMLLLAPGAQAQSSACELLKSELAARIDATGVHGYSLEAVPADTPVPPGAKAIGNCEAGASKILYRRWGAAQLSSVDAGATAPASAAQRRVAPDRQATRPTIAPSDRASQPTPVSAAGSTARPPLRSHAAASAVAAPARSPVQSALSASASDVTVMRAVDRSVAQPAAPVQPGKMPAATAPWTQRASDFMTEQWRWVLALIFLPVVGLIWAWHAHRSAYDEAGLPRGPKL